MPFLTSSINIAATAPARQELAVAQTAQSNIKKIAIGALIVAVAAKFLKRRK